jgi:hypothetical protein
VAIAGEVIVCPDCGEVIFKDAPECSNCHCPINGAEILQRHTRANVTPTPVTQEKPKPVKTQKVKRTYTALVVSLVIALIIVLLGLYFYQNTQQQNELHAYENAIASSEPTVLQNFLDVYVDAPSSHRDSVMAHLKELQRTDQEWDHAQAGKSKTELQRYIERHPGNVHVSEARLMIDSLDWVAAMAENTADAYQLYMDEHTSGTHYDEAREQFERLDAMRIRQSERDTLRVLFHQYFDALTRRDETLLGKVLSDEMSSFMQKENATITDAVSYMRSLYAPDVVNIGFTMTDDCRIVKHPTEKDGQYDYAVSFSVDERIDRSDQEKERFNSFKVVARVSAKGKIKAINMQKVIQ